MPSQWLREAGHLCAGLAPRMESTERFHCNEDMREFYRKSINRLFLSLTTGGKRRKKLSEGSAPKSCLNAAQPHWCSEVKCKTVIKNVYTNHHFRFSIRSRPCADRCRGEGMPRRCSSPGNPVQTDCGSGFPSMGKLPPCVVFFSSPAFLEQIRQGCCRGQDARPDGAACPGKSPICY